MHLPVGSAVTLDDLRLTVARQDLIRRRSYLQLVYED
jgi:hypothetical protein